jgi:LmbE family N-acetylglucosaminyl deacetylase
MGVWDQWTGARDYRARMRERRAEDVRVLRALGIEPLHFPFLEHPYRSQVTPALDLDHVVDAVRPLVVAADTLYAPAGIDGHPDHLFTRDVARALGIAPLCYYADLPYATSFGWPHWVTGEPRDRYLDVDAFWSAHTDVPTDVSLNVAVITLSVDAQRAKLEALRAYRTQFAALEAQDQRRISAPRFISFEVVWRPRSG